MVFSGYELCHFLVEWGAAKRDKNGMTNWRM